MTYVDRELKARGVGQRAIELRRLRRALKVTQRELAAMAGVCPATVGYYETGTPVSRAARQRIEDMMGRWREWLPGVRAARKPERRGRYNHQRDKESPA